MHAIPSRNYFSLLSRNRPLSCHLGHFRRIRYYGLLSSRNRKTNLAKCQQLLGSADTNAIDTPELLKWESVLAEALGSELKRCPECKEGYLIHEELLAPVRWAASHASEP